MVPGLWLEPEVVGVNSPVVAQLPPEAFFQRDGRLVTEHGRHHLDLRHPAAVKHLDEVVDFVVGDLGVGYLKLDYNIEIAPGPNSGGLSPGAGLLEANRAQLDWLDAVLDRHPRLVLENCSSGGMRTDYALLSRFQLQSTSDQQDPLRYPPIAAAAPAAIAPEQAANWAYPQPSFTDDEIAFTLCGAMLGRIYLSGHLDHMSREQRALVAEAVRVHKDLRGSLASALPFWPLGLPRWTDPWIALGLRTPQASYLTVWRRGPFDGGSGPGAGDQPGITLPVPHLRGQRCHRRRALPPFGRGRGRVTWDAAASTLSVRASALPVRLSHQAGRAVSARRYAVVGTGARAGLYIRALADRYAADGTIVAWCDPNRVRMNYYDEILTAAGRRLARAVRPGRLRAPAGLRATGRGPRDLARSHPSAVRGAGAAGRLRRHPGEAGRDLGRRRPAARGRGQVVGGHAAGDVQLPLLPAQQRAQAGDRRRDHRQGHVGPFRVGPRYRARRRLLPPLAPGEDGLRRAPGAQVEPPFRPGELVDR